MCENISCFIQKSSFFLCSYYIFTSPVYVSILDIQLSILENRAFMYYIRNCISNIENKFSNVDNSFYNMYNSFSNIESFAILKFNSQSWKFIYLYCKCTMKMISSGPMSETIDDMVMSFSESSNSLKSCYTDSFRRI